MNSIKQFQPNFTQKMQGQNQNVLARPITSIPQERDQVSFNGVAEVIAQKIPEKVLTSPTFHNILKFSERNASMFEAGVVLALATSVRPATIMALPGAKIEDRQYAAAKSIATGIIGFAIAALLYMPLSKSMERVAKVAKTALDAGSKAGVFPAMGTKSYDAFNYLINYGSKFIVGPIDAMLLFKLIPPIMHKIFPAKPGQKPKDPTPVFSAKLSEEQQKLLDDFVGKVQGGGNVR